MPPKRHFDLNKLGKDVFAKRGSRSMREVAEEIGIGASTLMRVENGSHHDPSLDTLERIWWWLNRSPADYFVDDPTQNDPVSVQLRALRGMSTATALTFRDVIRAALAEAFPESSDESDEI
jgi:transcriptional regulator with XRE-family HTH domain